MLLVSRMISLANGTFRFGSALGDIGTNSEASSMLTTILIVVLILALIGALPTWGYSRSWGYGPGGGIGLVLIILIILVLMGRV
jgi:hypothetical protein